MLYRLQRKFNLRRFDRAIAGILATSPIEVVPGPCAVVSMVANRDVPMYVAALKSFYPKLGFGQVVAIVDRDMPPNLRDTLAHHVKGIEFAILEDIQTTPCQRGGTWERVLFCLDRSEREYTIQMDADTLCVGENVDEVLACVRANRAFTMADGFTRQTLPETAAMAQTTPSDYIGIVAEQAFARYPGGESLHYIRGSSGFAGFAKGGYSRAGISAFHQEMEKLVGEKRWREWGSEQNASNFAVANSPDPVVLPYPEYASFTGRALRHRAKLFHFIGRFRFVEGYLARRTQEVIAALTPGAAPVAPPQAVADTAHRVGGLARVLTWDSAGRYLAWRLTGRAKPLQVQLKPRREFRSAPPPGPRLELQGQDLPAVQSVFVDVALFPPVWIPPERVTRIVDVGAGAGMSCVWWLANYWRPQVLAFEADPAQARRARASVALNGFDSRFELRERRPALVELGRDHIDILSLDGPGMLDDPGFAALDVGAVVVRGAASQAKRLEGLGFRTYTARDVLWAYRESPWGPFSLETPTPARAAETV